MIQLKAGAFVIVNLYVFKYLFTNITIHDLMYNFCVINTVIPWNACTLTVVNQ